MPAEKTLSMESAVQVSVLVHTPGPACWSPAEARTQLHSLLHNLAAQTLAEQLEILLLGQLAGEENSGFLPAFQGRFRRLVDLRQADAQPPAAALNHALQVAQGAWLTLTDPQQRHHPESFARLRACLQARPEAALAYADLALTPAATGLLVPWPWQSAPVTAFWRWPEFDPVSFFQQAYAGPQPMWRRALHPIYGGFDPEFVLAWDQEFWLRLLAGGEQFVHLPELLGLMYQPGPCSESQTDLRQREVLRSRQRYWQTQWGAYPASPPPPPFAGYVQAQPERYPTQARVSVLLRVEAGSRERLSETLWSVLSQHYPQMELLLINASQQDLRSWLAAIPDLPPTLLLEAPLLEAHQARNLALRLARGQYILGLSSGDRWHGNHLLRHLEALQAHAFVYSEAWRLPHPQASSFDARRLQDRNNTPELLPDRLAGQFLPRAATSYRRSLLAALPLEAGQLLNAKDLWQWQETEVYRQTGLFGAAARIFPDWDWQWLALQQVQPHRLDQVTCEIYEARAAELPVDSPLLPFAQRVRAAVAGLAQPPALPAAPERVLVLLFVPDSLTAFYQAFPPPRPPLLLFSGAGPAAETYLDGHELPPGAQLQVCYPLGWMAEPDEMLQLLRQATRARELVILTEPAGLSDWQQSGGLVPVGQGLQVWLDETWQSLEAAQLAALWPHIRLLFVRAADQANSQG